MANYSRQRHNINKLIQQLQDINLCDQEAKQEQNQLHKE